MHLRRPVIVRILIACSVFGILVLPAEARTGRYLIVTASGFSSSAALSQLSAARSAAGLDVVTYSVPAGTTREVIRSYIQSWYDPTQPAYVLILGDSDGTGSATATTIPHWIGAAFHGSTTDLPYSCMGGDDDWYPDLYLGRFPVDTATELQAAVDKTLFVEAEAFPDPAYAQRAVFINHEDDTPQGEQAHDWLINNYFTPAGFTSQRIYQSQGGTTAQISQAVNTGCLFATYFGHSSFSGWWGPSFNSTNVQALTNAGRYGVVLSISCGTSRFDWSYGECFGEYWLRSANKGAAAYISSTTLIYSGGLAEWESVKRLEKYFYRAFLQQGVWEVGPAWQAAQYGLLSDPDFGPTHAHTRDYFEMFVLIGDPALRLPHDSTHERGDLNCDGAKDGLDVSAFVLALLDPTGYAAAYPTCQRMTADCNGDGQVTAADTSAFVALLLSS